MSAKATTKSAAVSPASRKGAIRPDHATRRDASTNDASSDQSGVLERGLSIIKTLADARQPMSLTGIADATNMDPSTVHRLLKTLSKHEYAIKDPATKKYLPGVALLHPVGLFHPLQELRRDAQPVMQDLASRTGLTVAVIIYLGVRRLVLDIRHGAERLAPYYDANHTRPLNATAVGKIYLSALSASRAHAALGPEPYPRLTVHSLTTWKELEADLEVTRQRGYAAAVDESLIGLVGFAAPLRFANERRVIGALTTFGSSRNMNDARMKQIGVDITNLASMLGLMAASLRALSELIGPDR